MHKDIIQILFKLIRIGLGEPVEDFPNLDSTQWQELYTLARQQTIVGVIYKSIERLPKEKRPPRELLFKWIATTERIKELNQHINKTAQKVESQFRDNNFHSCILKGQGIAQLYPNPELRTSGDIDIWINNERKEIISFVNKFSKSLHAVYHHIDGLKIDGVEIETHFTPSYMANPFANRRLQKWIQNESIKQFEHCTSIGEGITIHTPTLAFNRVFILHHIYRHFFYEGIGLRQMMDFYYVLKQNFTKEEQEESQCIYKKLNLINFAGAAVYVLREIFGLEEMFYIVAPNEKYGKVLLSEILSGGNFGQVKQQRNTKENKIQRGWRIIKRSLQFIMYEPLEVVWLPYFKVMNNLLYVRSISNR